MMNYTQDQVNEMDLETAKAEISNAVYEASRLFEQLECAGRKVRGNGHHMRQKVAEFSSALMEERWDG